MKLDDLISELPSALNTAAPERRVALLAEFLEALVHTSNSPISTVYMEARNLVALAKEHAGAQSPDPSRLDEVLEIGENVEAAMERLIAINEKLVGLIDLIEPGPSGGSGP